VWQRVGKEGGEGKLEECDLREMLRKGEKRFINPLKLQEVARVRQLKGEQKGSKMVHVGKYGRGQIIGEREFLNH